ncbi:MAG: hypothetical protein PHE27_00245 [Alphaproteobacteria bacterium]|nr:hypothetical protein [Alphaproteobacteria bacterium]
MGFFDHYKKGMKEIDPIFQAMETKNDNYVKLTYAEDKRLKNESALKRQVILMWGLGYGLNEALFFGVTVGVMDLPIRTVAIGMGMLGLIGAFKTSVVMSHVKKTAKYYQLRGERPIEPVPYIFYNRVSEARIAERRKEPPKRKFEQPIPFI